jgi:photosystem II stability/assembly factor-like uncharacterized protein
MGRHVPELAIALVLFATGCGQPFPQDRNIHWHQADGFSIQMSAAEDAWHAGHVNDILKLEPENGMLVASEAGGVWEISRNAQAKPLTDGWPSSSMSALARGPDGSRHVYAGTWNNAPSEGGVLMETDTSSSSPLHIGWRRVDPKPPCGSIWKILVINEVRRIVLACDNGLYWSQIPPAPSAQGTYSWIDATPATIKVGASSSDLAKGPPSAGSSSNTGTKAGPPFSGLVKGPGWTNRSEGTIVAARWGGEAPGAAIYSGSWSGGKLLFGPSNVDQGPGTSVLPMDRTSLAACAADPRFMFTVASSANRSMVGVWQSTDGGQKWTIVGMPPDPGLQGNYNNAIALSSDCKIVAVGWQHGTFVSYNGGGAWNLLSGGGHVHADVHALTFDPADPATLYIGSDGGVVSASRLGPGGPPIFASNWNRQLFNLEFYHADGSTAASGLVAGGLQDNGVVYAGLPGPWQHVTNCGCDGRWAVFLTPPPEIGAGKSILLEQEWSDDEFPFCWVQTNGTNIAFNTQQGILVSPPSNEVLKNVLTVPVRSPGGYSNAAGQALFAFGGTGTNLYGLFANDDGSGLHWEPFSDIGGGNIAALAPTYNGQSVFVGTDAGNILRLDAPFTQWVQLTVNLPAGSSGDPSVTGLVSFYSTLAYATMNIGGEGYVMSLDGNNWNWNSVASNLPHDRLFNSIVASDLRSIFVSTGAYVYDTHDGGKTWTQASSGLPANITGRNELKIVRESGRVAYLYLATHGRSLWRAQLPNASGSSGGGSGGVGPLPVPSR